MIFISAERSFSATPGVPSWHSVAQWPRPFKLLFLGKTFIDPTLFRAQSADIAKVPIKDTFLVGKQHEFGFSISIAFLKQGGIYPYFSAVLRMRRASAQFCTWHLVELLL